MAKRTATRDTEGLLSQLVEKVSPAELRIMIPRFAALRERAAFEISAASRGLVVFWTGNTLAEAAQSGLDYLESPPEDPWLPAWSRCRRLQREYVRNRLLAHGAEQTAKAVTAKMEGRHDRARAAFELADALHAAIAELDFVDTDEDGMLIPDEPLAEGGASMEPIGPRKKPRR